MEIVRYFVDEAGDFTLFNRRGAMIVGQPGVSHCLMVGTVMIPDPEAADQKIASLRADLLADPYFRGVPSMQLESGKTSLCFHACKDIPEVRREVFRLLPQLGCKVHVAIRRKRSLAAIAVTKRREGKRLTANDIYDDLVSRLFRNLLHKPDQVQITFARRTKTDRDAAMMAALERARKRFRQKWKIESTASVATDCRTPSECAGLQVVDYYLWALQRLFELGEDRYFSSVAEQYRLIMDLDDHRHHAYGEWYSDSNPLTKEKIMPVSG